MIDRSDSVGRQRPDPPAPAAILVLARDPGCERKQFGLGTFRSREFHRRLFRRTLDSALGIAPVVVATDRPDSLPIPAGVQVVAQRGRSFRTRLRGAIADTFALGFRRIVVIGTDTPSLVREDLARALVGGQVVGPAPDGGCYLFTVESVDLPGLEALPWCTRHLGAALVSTLRARHGDVLLLDAKSDLDDAASLSRAAELLRAQRVWPEPGTRAPSEDRTSDGHCVPVCPARPFLLAPAPDRAPPPLRAA